MELRNGRGNEGDGKEMPVGKQMLAPFIGLFVGHDVSSGHETSRGFSLCWRASNGETTTALSTKAHQRTTYSRYFM